MLKTRRGFLKAQTLSSALVFFAPYAFSSESKSSLDFTSVPYSTKDLFLLPKGYSYKILAKWGDALFSNALSFDERKNITNKYAQNAALVFGDNADGNAYFPLGDGSALLASNNEYCNLSIMFNHKGKNLSKEDVLYMQNSVGVSIVEIKKDKNNFYAINPSSSFNRRITANTPCHITGPAKSNRLLLTKQDPLGEVVLGSFNNCGCSKTPWGSYLTCEENFNDFFGSKNKSLELSEDFKRYGISPSRDLYGWHLYDDRFDISKNPNEPNRFGYVVEINPYDKSFIPKKRTALGRFKHENCEIVIDAYNNVVCYSGDDENNEFVYKFVAKNKFSKNMDENKDILEDGILYVARFEGIYGDFKGKLKWVRLEVGHNNITKENGFLDKSDVFIKTRQAASLAKATCMDRCEWIKKDPNSEFLFATFTNNKIRKNVDASNPREANIYGQILKFAPVDNNHASLEFTWEMFVLAGNPVAKKGIFAGSKNINKDNMFNSPDGLAFGKEGRLYIATDGDYSNKGDYINMGNNQILCADTKSGEIKRFCTGPVACELTGITFSDDYKSMFVSIQHPGENLARSNFPQGGSFTPKSCVVVINRDDGSIFA